MIRKVGIYLRLSKEDERLGESGSITNQRAILLDYIKKNGLEFVSEYVDDGVSGTTFDRIGFQKMISDIESNKINMVITKDTSRLGRDHIEFGFYVEKYFPEHNVRYVAVCDDIDTESNHNDMLLFKSAYNDMYVKDISNKIRASLNIKKRNGEFVGAYAPYGYKKSVYDRHRLVVDEEAAVVVREIYDLFLKGCSVNRIKDVLTERNVKTPSCYKNMRRKGMGWIWSTRTITDILTNPTYIGNLAQGRCKKVSYKSKKKVHVSRSEWIVKEGACPKIIDEKVFNMVQNIFHSNKYKINNYNELLLKGLVYCEECGHRIGFRKVSRVNKMGEKVIRYYGNCNYYLKNRRYGLCSPHSLSYKDLESIIKNNIYDILLKIDRDKLICELQKNIIAKDTTIMEINDLEKRLKLLDLKKKNLYEDKISNFIGLEVYLEFNKKIDNEKMLVEEKLIEKRKKSNGLKIFDWKRFLDDKLKCIDLYLVNCLIDKITFNESGKIKIYYKIKNCEVNGYQL